MQKRRSILMTKSASLRLTPLSGTSLMAFTVGLAAAWCCLSAESCLAVQGEWQSPSAVSSSSPAKNRRVSQQPRPPSAPTAPDGHAVTLEGTIEACILLKQPRPLSSVPR